VKYLVLVVLWAASLYWFTEDAYVVGFEQGFEQGYEEGQVRALTSPQALETCTKWWFDGSESRAKQAMNQYCDRRKK
jgi:hypothetical protein